MIRPPAAVLACGLCVLLGSSPARLQERQPAFTSRTSLVTISVIALDRDGRPVPGLAAGDFEVKINGRTQPVQAVAYLDVPDTALGRGPVATDAAAAPVRRIALNAAPLHDARVFVIVVDDLSFEPGQGKALFVSAEAFVARLPAADYAGIALTSGAQAINPTRDRGPIISALKRVTGQSVSPARVHTDPPIISVGEAMQIEGGNTGIVQQIQIRECFDPKQALTMTSISVEALTRLSPCAAVVPSRASLVAAQVKAVRQRQIQSLASLIASLGTVTGIKHVVLLSNGFAVSRDVNDFAPIARAAAIAGVHISTMVQEGDIDLADVGSSVETGNGSGTSPTGAGQAQRRREDDLIMLGGAQTMTDMAGGQFYRVIGQPLRFFERVATAASAVYRLGVALPPGLAPGKAIEVTAAVKRSGVTALTSQRSAAPLPDLPATPDEQVRNALNRGDTLYGVPLRVAAVVRRASTAGVLEIGATVSTPATTTGPVSFSVGLVDRDGAIRTSTRSVVTPAADYRATVTLPVTPGAYQIRAAAVDAGGHVGSVTLGLNAALTTIGAYDASDVLLWTTDAQGNRQFLPFEELPAGLRTLTAMVELYARGASAPDPRVRFAVLDAGGAVIAEKEGGIAIGGAGVARADASFDGGSLTAGAYTLRATVTIDGKAAGAVTTGFQKR